MNYPKMEVDGGKFSMRFQRHGWPVKRFSARTGTVVELVQLFIAEKIDTRQSSLQTRYRESNRLEHFCPQLRLWSKIRQERRRR